jgi:hypothetical protein
MTIKTACKIEKIGNEYQLIDSRDPSKITKTVLRKEKGNGQSVLWKYLNKFFDAISAGEDAF